MSVTDSPGACDYDIYVKYLLEDLPSAKGTAEAQGNCTAEKSVPTTRNVLRVSFCLLEFGCC